MRHGYHWCLRTVLLRNGFLVQFVWLWLKQGPAFGGGVLHPLSKDRADYLLGTDNSPIHENNVRYRRHIGMKPLECNL